jgi:hypothetical protein
VKFHMQTQLTKAREQQQQQQQQQQQPQSQQSQHAQQQQQMQIQQLMLQRHAQQQQQQQQNQQQAQSQQQPQPQQQQNRDRAHLLNGSANGLGGNPGTANSIATKMYEERLKVPPQRDSLDDAAMKVEGCSGYRTIRRTLFL